MPASGQAGVTATAHATIKDLGKDLGKDFSLTILLVEGDIAFGAAIVERLTLRFGVYWSRTLGDAELALSTSSFVLGIIDTDLPDGAGLPLLQGLRRQRNNLPVIMISAIANSADRIAALNAGADDYLVKPFDPDELMARCLAVLRRFASDSGPIIAYGDLVYDRASQRLTRAGASVLLSANELKIFDILVTNIGRVISKQQIESRLYGWNEDIESNTVEVHLSHLRAKIGSETIRTLRRLGYTMPRQD